MKKNDFQFLKGKSPADLQKELRLSRQKLSNLRFDLASGKVKNIKEIKAIKKNIARVLTIVNKKDVNKNL